MAHKIRIACLGTSDSLSRAVDALLDNQVIPAENIFLSRTDGPQVERFSASGCQLLPDDMNAIVKGELVRLRVTKWPRYWHRFAAARPDAI